LGHRYVGIVHLVLCAIVYLEGANDNRARSLGSNPFIIEQTSVPRRTSITGTDHLEGKISMTRAFFCLILLFATGLTISAQTIDGNWSGVFRTNGPSGTFEFTFASAADQIGGMVAISFDGREMKSPFRSVRLDNGHLEMSTEMDGSPVNFSGTVNGARIIGTFEVLEKSGARELTGVFCVSRDAKAPCLPTDLPELPNVQTNTQRADPDFDTRVSNPAFTLRHPKVLFDEAHRNLHTTTGLFKPFADLITHDGFAVTANANKFSSAVLSGFDLLVIANARGEEGGGSAFDDQEIEAVVAWVKAGGSLFFIADHTPMGGWAEKLSAGFGVGMSKGYTDDPQHRDPVLKDLLFTRENKLLENHALTNGRNRSERVSRIVSFTGQSLSIPRGGVAVLKLGDTAYDEFPNSDKKVPAAGRAQLVALKFGKGRVIVSGEAAMFTAQIAPNGEKFGMNAAGIDNRQFTLNVMHWLGRALK
jgi:hypothetical protein